MVRQNGGVTTAAEVTIQPQTVGSTCLQSVHLTVHDTSRQDFLAVWVVVA